MACRREIVSMSPPLQSGFGNGLLGRPQLFLPSPDRKEGDDDGNDFSATGCLCAVSEGAVPWTAADACVGPCFKCACRAGPRGPARTRRPLHRPRYTNFRNKTLVCMRCIQSKTAPQKVIFSANCITRGVKPMLEAVIWPNAPAFVGMPAGLSLTVQLEMAAPGRANCGVFVIL